MRFKFLNIKFVVAFRVRDLYHSLGGELALGERDTPEPVKAFMNHKHLWKFLITTRKLRAHELASLFVLYKDLMRRETV